MKNEKTSVRYLLYFLMIGEFLIISQDAYSQGGGGAGAASAGLQQATTQVKSAFAIVINLMYAICAIIGVVGAISVYSAWSNGDPDTRKKASSWFGALIFAGLVAVVLTAVFG